MRVALPAVSILAAVIACGGTTTTSGGDASRDSPPAGHPNDASSVDVHEDAMTSPDVASVGDSETDDGAPLDAAACTRDGGAEAGQCCAKQSDCGPIPVTTGLCCNDLHVCALCSTMR